MRMNQIRYSGSVLALVLILAMLSLGPAPLARATTITVTTTQDELNDDGDCSLREAIQAANTDTEVDECPAGDGADTISLPSGTYFLSLPGADEDDNATGDLDITEELIIEECPPEDHPFIPHCEELLEQGQWAGMHPPPILRSQAVGRIESGKPFWVVDHFDPDPGSPCLVVELPPLLADDPGPVLIECPLELYDPALLGLSVDTAGQPGGDIGPEEIHSGPPAAPSRRHLEEPLYQA